MSNETSSNETALAVIDGQEFAIMASERPVSDLVKEALGPESIGLSDLEQLRVPPGGGLTWEFSEGSTREFVGVIVGNRMGRAFWREEYAGGNSPPDCSSGDCIQGVGDPGGDCATCPFAQWESAPNGRGQACKQGRLLLIVIPGSILPVVLRLPPTSLKDCRHYLSRAVVAKAKRPWEVCTKFSLRREDNGNVPAFSVVKMEFAGSLSSEQEAFFQEVKDTFSSSLESVAAVETVSRDSNDPADADAEAVS